MTIIPYVRPGCLDSNTLRHFNTIRSAVEWAFDDMYTQPNNTDTIQKRFRIIDTEEDFTVSFSKKDGDIIVDCNLNLKIGDRVIRNYNNSLRELL